MSVTPSPIGGFAAQFFDNNGVILSGGKIYTYAAGTTTPQAAYTSASGTTPHANPIILDSAGRVPGGEIWLTDGLVYKFVIETAAAILIGTYDNIAGINDPQTAAETALTPSGYTTATNVQTAFDNLGSSAGATKVGYIYTGGVAQSVATKLAQTISVKDFGAVGNGTTDDTAAFVAALAACPSGGEIYLPPNATYLISQTLVLTKPVVIRGGAKENTKILFKSSGTYLAAPYKCGILAPHSTTVVPSYSGNAVRSSLSGFTLDMQAGPTALTGLLVCTPIYVNEVDAINFSGNGFAVNASVAPSVDIIGNANGATFTNCAAKTNTLSGFYTYGNNANACVFLGCRTFENTEWGFYEDGFLGNSYISCETDGNLIGGYGGYVSVGAAANRSCYIGCYSETNQPTQWDLGVYTTRLGAQNSPGASSALDGISISAIPNGEFYFNKALNFAATDQIAQDQSGGVYTRLDKDGLDLYLNNGGREIKFSGLLSTNYTDILSNTSPVIRFPNTAVTGNIAVDRPFIPGGISFSADSAITGAGTAIPVSGTFSQGAILLNETPSASGFIGWVCVTGGTPGTWKTFGAISA